MSTRSGEGRKGVEAYSADELHRFLVEDAVKSHATEFQWMMAALARIAEVRHAGDIEMAYVAVVEAKRDLTGSSLMPIAAATPRELRALGLR